MPQNPHYVVRLYRKGRFTAANRIRYADSYSVYRNGKLLVSRRPFTPAIKKADDRRDFLASLVESLERKRQRENQKRRRARVAARLKELEKKEEKKRARRARKAKKDLAKVALDLEPIVTRIPIAETDLERQVREESVEEYEEDEEDKIAFDLTREMAKRGLPIFPQARSEQGLFWKNVSETDVTIIPVKPVGEEYTVDLVEKIIEWTNGRRNAYSIYNYTLRDDFLIPMTGDNFREAASYAVSLFLPHLLYFWSSTKKSTDGYILRIKFGWEPKGSDTTLQGVSLPRLDISSPQQMAETLAETFGLLFGKKGRLGKLRVRNYLEGETMIFIRGFTLESYLDKV